MLQINRNAQREKFYLLSEEVLHLLVVPGQHKNNLTAEVLNLWQEIVENGCSPVVVARSELVGLVNEENATAIIQNIIDDFLDAGYTRISET